MLNSLRSKNINCEQEAKFIQDRIVFVERNLAEFCQTFAQYSRKAARVRDKGDEIARVTNNYSESESINKSLSEELGNFASILTTISDYGDMRVKNIDSKIVHELGQYEGICKNVKEEVKQIFSARDKELLRKRQLDRIRERNPRNRQQIIQAETELVKAAAEVSKSVHNLEEQITAFERQKLHDIKNILLDFIATEMGYHAKALELLTTAYQHIESIDEESDLQDFKRTLKMPDTIPHTTTKRSLFRSTQSLGSITTLFSSPKKKDVNHPGISKNNVTKSEETLDSMKRSITETEESESEEESTEDDTETEDKESPAVIRKYLK